MHGLAADVQRLGDAVRTLGRLDRFQSRTVGSRAGIARGTLGIDTTEEPATFASANSTEEINSVLTSYSTHEPGWSGSSGATATLSGVYGGDQGDDTLDFAVTESTALSVSIEVTDGSGAVVETMAFDPTAGAQSQTLSNGLELHLDGGAVTLGDTFSVDVFASVGTAVNPDAAFNGTGDAAPEFDPGQAVGAGSFSLNGVNINVSAGDSLRDVLDRINASAAGVDAQFDVDTESVVLTQQTAGSAPDITFGSDTSGFLDAVKLSGAATTGGMDAAPAESIDDLLVDIASMSGVVSGTFLIDGQSVAVDVETDTIADVLSRINASAPVTASVTEDGTLTVMALRKGDFKLADDDTGLLGALGLEEREYVGYRGTKSVSLENREGVRSAIVEIRDAYNELLRGPRVGVTASAIREVRSRLTVAMGTVFSGQLDLSGAGILDSDLGLELSAFDNAKTRSLDLNPNELSKALRSKDGEFIEFLFGSLDGPVGMVEALEEGVTGALESLERKIGRQASLGLRLDLYG